MELLKNINGSLMRRNYNNMSKVSIPSLIWRTRLFPERSKLTQQACFHRDIDRVNEFSDIDPDYWGCCICGKMGKFEDLRVYYV